MYDVVFGYAGNDVISCHMFHVMCILLMLMLMLILVSDEPKDHDMKDESMTSAAPSTSTSVSNSPTIGSPMSTQPSTSESAGMWMG